MSPLSFALQPKCSCQSTTPHLNPLTKYIFRISNILNLIYSKLNPIIFKVHSNLGALKSHGTLVFKPSYNLSSTASLICCIQAQNKEWHSDVQSEYNWL